jgi:PAS domain S-box-containing protein
MFGYSANEVVGKNVKCLMPEPYRSEHDGYLANYLNTAEKKIIGVGREALAKRKNGEEFPIDLAVSEVETIDDTVIFTGIIRDITKQKEHEQELYLAAKDAEQANRAKSEFLSAMSHELRTPLNAVIGFSQLLASDKLHPLNEEQKQSITYILESGNQLLGLVDDILDLSKIENGQLNVVYEPVELNMVVEQSVKLVQTQADSKSIKIDNQLANQLPQHVNADVKKLRQVILNILSNAIKYNVDGGEVCIYTKITNEDTVRLSFSDTGHGIAESVLEHLFEPFNRLGKEKSSIQGTGIGLTISKNLTELMGGRLGAENNLDKGMTFWIELTTYHGVHEDQKARGHQG